MTRLAAGFLTLAILALSPLTALAAAPKKVAMVVGTSAYQATTPLANTLNDAKAVAASLERLGFDVITAYDATQNQLLDTLQQFSREVEGADAAVFYYAGHGMQIDGENYILPVDIRVESELAVRYGALSLTDVLEDVERRSRVAIVILDACRDNPLAAMLADTDPSRSAGVSRGLAPMKPSGNGAIIAYAAAPGQVASDGTDGHSPYTAALLAEMEKPGVEVGLLFRRVAGRVIDETGGTQRPEILVRLASEYYLTDLPPVPVVVPTAAPVLPQAAPVDIAPIVVAQAEPVVAPDTEVRQAVEEAGDRAALWDYTSLLVESPFDQPAVAWVPPPSKTIGDMEPNDSFGSAQLVEPNDVLNLAIAPARDHDSVRFAVGQGGRLTVHAPQTPEEITLTVRLLNANGDELVYWVPAARGGGELKVDFDLPRAGSYWLQFADNANSGTSPDTFPVTLSFAPQADLYEPNDRADFAKHIPLESAFPINILPRGEQDFFKLTAPSAGSLIVSLTDAPESIDTVFRVLDANGREVVYWIPAPRPGGDNVAVVDLPSPGVYFLNVADSNSDAADIAPITLSTRFVPSPDTLEPNDTMGAAYPVEANSTQTMAIFPARDSDWVELDIAQPGELTLEVKTPPSNLTLTYRVLDGNGLELQYWSPAARPGGDLVGAFDFARPGRYYLQIADNANAGSIEKFDLNLAFTASLDSYEPNDSFGAARPLTPGGEVAFTILPKGDADFFRVTVDQPGELAITIDESPDNLDLTYRVLNPDWTELAYWVPAYRMGGLTEGMVDLPRAGTYYLEVRDSNNDARSIEPATLKTVFTATAGSNEPNNTFGEATPVEITGETVMHVLPLRDSDWHVFYAESAGELDVEIDGVPENIDAVYRVLDADRAEIQYWVQAPRPGGVTTGTVAIPKAGWYWMEIADGNGDARSPLPFTVKRTFRPAS